MRYTYAADIFTDRLIVFLVRKYRHYAYSTVFYLQLVKRYKLLWRSPHRVNSLTDEFFGEITELSDQFCKFFGNTSRFDSHRKLEYDVKMSLESLLHMGKMIVNNGGEFSPRAITTDYIESYFARIRCCTGGLNTSVTIKDYRYRSNLLMMVAACGTHVSAKQTNNGVLHQTAEIDKYKQVFCVIINNCLDCGAHPKKKIKLNWLLMIQSLIFILYLPVNHCRSCIKKF